MSDVDTVLAGFTRTDNYLFGTGVTAGAGDTALKNTTALRTVFKAYQFNAGMTSIGSELERYTDFHFQTHIFAADRLNLTAVLGGGDAAYSGGFTHIWGDIVGTIDVRIPVDPAKFGFPTGTVLEIGRCIVLQSRGIYRIDSFEANGFVNLLPLLGSAALNDYPVGNALAALTPFYALRLTQVTADNAAGTQTFLYLDNIPASMPQGLAVGYEKDGAFQRNNDYRAVTLNKTAKLAVINKKMTYLGYQVTSLPVGTMMFFVPPIRSAQIVTNQTFDLKNGDFAFDAVLNFPTAVSSRHVNKLIELNALPVDQPNGLWAGDWLYGANKVPTSFGGDELDIEIWNDLQKGPDVFSAFTHAKPISQAYMVDDAEWTPSTMAGYIVRDAGPLIGDVRLTKVVRTSDGQVDTYVNGKLVDTKNFLWENPNQAEFIINLAVGSIQSNMAANCLFPLRSENMNNMKIGVKSATFYKKNP